MSTYTQCLHHIIFGTKNRRPTLVAPHRRELFGYMYGIIKRLDCHLYRLNGVEDHVHLLVGLHPDLGPAKFVKELKQGTSNWMLKGTLFPQFDHWQEGYGAFTLGWAQRDHVIDYIKGQEAHHQHESFLEEYRRFLREAGLELDERYLP